MQPCTFIVPYSNMKLLKPLIALPHLNIPDVILKNEDYCTWLCRYGSQCAYGSFTYFQIKLLLIIGCDDVKTFSSRFHPIVEVPKSKTPKLSM
jgi:hypothetical protein